MLPEGATWLDAPWFFVENWFYAALGSAWGDDTDMFASKKLEALDAADERFQDTVLPLVRSCSIRGLLHRSLWGNRADLSLSNGLVGEDVRGEKSDADALLADHSGEVLAHLESFKAGGGAHIVMMLDNCGLEFVSDLALVDALLETGLAKRIDLHMKPFPVFVSDVMPKDVQPTIEWIRKRDKDVASRLEARLAAGTLRLVSHPFYVSPLPSWDAPHDIQHSWRKADLVISKGDGEWGGRHSDRGIRTRACTHIDSCHTTSMPSHGLRIDLEPLTPLWHPCAANYRRLLGDAHWPVQTPWEEAVSYFPAPLLALRTLKCEVAVGVTAELEAEARKEHGNAWWTTGVYGVLQFKP
jgi:hypothetical protein